MSTDTQAELDRQLARDKKSGKGTKKEGKNSYAINTSYTARLIKRRGYSKRQVANAIGVSEVMFYRWLSGKSQVRARNLIKLAKFLKVDACALLETDDQRVYKYFRDLMNRKIEHDREIAEDTEDGDLPVVDFEQFIKICKFMGFDIVKELKLRVDPSDFDVPNTEAENQILQMLEMDTED